MIMIISGFRASVAISAVSAAVAAALPVAVSPTAYADDQWGSCAVPANPASSYSVFCSANGRPTQADAETGALGICNYLRNRQCYVVISYTDCGAVAGNGNQWTGANGATQQDAEQAAVGQLAGSTVTKSACVVYQ
jgi:Domain of unknown function (DUF4189)